MSMPMKREHGSDGGAGGEVAVAVTLPRKLQRMLPDALSPVSPTVAAGVLPRASVYASPHPQVVEEFPPAATTPASSADPIQALEAIRGRLALSTDPHLQAKLLLQFSHVAISPGAPTNSAIDFLFSFLQQSQSATSSSVAQDAKSEREVEATVSRTTGGPIVVGAIVRGLRKLLAVKAKVVEPMIQVDAMGEQLMQCVSVAEDFKLRQDMIQIVVDCLMITRAHAQVETLLGTCVRDHDPVMQAICLQGYLRLHDAGYHFMTAPAKLFDLASTLLLHGGSGSGEDQKQERVQLWAVRLVTALSRLYPLLDVASKFFAQGSTLRDTAFYVLCMSASGVSAEVRKEIALSLRASKDTSTHVVEHALQKIQISEELAEDSALTTVMMLSSGTLLDLLEDKADEVSTEASRTIGYLAMTAKWSEQILDRTISAHVDLLPAASKSKSRFPALVRTLKQLLTQRKELYGAEFSLTSEEANYTLHDEAIQTDASAMLSILSVLIRCDTCSVWMVQRVVEYVLLVAENLVNNSVMTCVQSEQQLLRLAKEIQLKCGATIQMDTALVDKLSREATQHQQLSSVKAEVCLMLLGKSGRANVSSGNGSESQSLSVQSEILPRPSSAKELLAGSNERKESSDYKKLFKLSSGEQDFTSGLKSIIRLRKTADVKSEASGLRIVELLLQLKQHVRAFPNTTASPSTKSSSYVSMDAMLGNDGISDNNVKKLNEFSRLALPAALVHGCEEIVRLASNLYIKESGLSSSTRADLLQLTLLARVGLVISQLQPLKKDGNEIAASLQWLVHQASQLRFLINDKTGTIWLSAQLLSDVSSLNELKGEFVGIVRKAWPQALLQALPVLQSQPSRSTFAVIYEPEVNNKEPREIVAQWPFAVRVKSVVENLSDLTRVFIKSVLPNGETAIHHVPVHAISFKANPSSYFVDHSIKLTISPFSDPTSYSVALCLQYPALPGALEMTRSGNSLQAQVTYVEISEPVSERIFHRTNSTIRRG